MALALDPSTPVKVAQTSIATGVTTASFTPPANSLLVAGAWCSQNAASMSFNISDTDASTPAWTTILQRNSASSGGWQSCAGLYYTTAPSGSAMTVTATVVNSFLPTLKVWVITGFDPSDPIGASAGQSFTSTSAATTGFVNTRASSMGLIVACNNAANLVTSNDATAYENGPASNGHYGLGGYKLPLGSSGATSTFHLECSGTVGIHVVQVEIKAALPAGGVWRRRNSGLLVR